MNETRTRTLCVAISSRASSFNSVLSFYDSFFFRSSGTHHSHSHFHSHPDSINHNLYSAPSISLRPHSATLLSFSTIYAKILSKKVVLGPCPLSTCNKSATRLVYKISLDHSKKYSLYVFFPNYSLLSISIRINLVVLAEYLKHACLVLWIFERSMLL